MRGQFFWSKSDNTTTEVKDELSLASFNCGQCGRIVALEGGVRQRRKLMALGLAPGRRFRFIRGGRFHPICLNIDGTELVLGTGMAKGVIVKAV